MIYFKEGIRFGAEPVTLKPIVPSLKVWREIFATALDDLAGLVSPRRIIFCEGRADPGKGGHERGLDADVLNTIFAQAYPGTQFVSSGGNTELDQRMAITVSIISKVLPTLEIYLLKDRDIASGKKTTEADRQQYLSNNAANHRVLKRWEIENYLFDREILEVYCSAEGLTFDDTAYAALVGNINDDDVKDETNRIKNICGITTSVDPEKFKRNLAAVIRPEMAVYKELEDCIFNGNKTRFAELHNSAAAGKHNGRQLRYAALRSNDWTKPPTYDRTSIFFRDNLRTAFGALLRRGGR